MQGIRTNAKKDGDDWILNGSKTFVTNGWMADTVIVVAITNPQVLLNKGIMFSRMYESRTIPLRSISTYYRIAANKTLVLFHRLLGEVSSPWYHSIFGSKRHARFQQRKKARKIRTEGTGNHCIRFVLIPWRFFFKYIKYCWLDSSHFMRGYISK